MSDRVLTQFRHALPREMPAVLWSVREILPGLVLCSAIAVAAFAAASLPGLSALSPLIIAILIGIGVRNAVRLPSTIQPGIGFAMRRVLRAAVVLLGLQITLQQVGEVGAAGIAIVAATLASTFLFTKWLGRVMGVERRLAELIAAGTAVCGASAVAATNTVTRGHEEDVAYAVACVTLFGTLSMVLMPMLPGLFHLDPRAYGLWTGASIHEVAQVVAAAFQDGQQAGEFGTVAKLTRVMMLAPLVLVLAAYAARAARRNGGEAGRAAVPLPWFVFGFIALILVNSLGVIPHEVKEPLVAATRVLLAIALAAMGLLTHVGKLREAGLRPLVLGGAAWLFVSAFSLALVKLAA